MGIRSSLFSTAQTAEAAIITWARRAIIQHQPEHQPYFLLDSAQTDCSGVNCVSSQKYVLSSDTCEGDFSWE